MRWGGCERAFDGIPFHRQAQQGLYQHFSRNTEVGKPCGSIERGIRTANAVEEVRLTAPRCYLLRTAIDGHSVNAAFMQFKKGALVPYAGVVYRVEKADVFNGHVCYLLLDPQGVAQPVAHAQHSFIVEEIKRIARFQVRDKFTIQGYFGWRYVKERWWDSVRGCVMYRLNDNGDEHRVSIRMSQDELLKHEQVTAEEMARYAASSMGGKPS